MAAFSVRPPPSARVSLTEAGQAARADTIQAHRATVAELLDHCTLATDDDVTALFTPTPTLHVPGRHRYAGTFTGADALVGQLRDMLGHRQVRQQITKYEDWLDSDDRVLTIVRARMQLPGRVHEWTRLFLFTLAGDKITRIDVFEDDQRLLDAFITRDSG